VIVGAELHCVGPIDGEQVQHRKGVVPAPPGKLGRQAGRPVAAIHLEAVAEHRTHQPSGHGIEHQVADRPQVCLGSCRGVVIKDQTLCTHRRSLDVLPGAAGVPEQHNPGTLAGLDDHLTVHDGQLLI
jgi:hypothetical protein